MDQVLRRSLDAFETGPKNPSVLG
ncbi:unnamed protein product [Spirodela intermedia]|uniref:Uncharacterized protein n=1 Tax=Spirodela intermedia TaxID=51605 RepID=A0A7I8KLJ9_SPIIN|nr:unnamed protein product [Spirodela intermedia]